MRQAAVVSLAGLIGIGLAVAVFYLFIGTPDGDPIVREDTNQRPRATDQFRPPPNQAAELPTAAEPVEDAKVPSVPAKHSPATPPGNPAASESTVAPRSKSPAGKNNVPEPSNAIPSRHENAKESQMRTKNRTRGQNTSPPDADPSQPSVPSPMAHDSATPPGLFPVRCHRPRPRKQGC